MKRALALTLALLLAPAAVLAQVGIGTTFNYPTATFTVTSNTATGALLVNNTGSVTVQTSGTFGGVVLQFQGSTDSELSTPSRWVTMTSCYPAGSATATSGASTATLIRCGTVGLKWVRFQPNSAGASTSVTVTLVPSTVVLPVVAP